LILPLLTENHNSEYLAEFASILLWNSVWPKKIIEFVRAFVEICPVSSDLIVLHGDRNATPKPIWSFILPLFLRNDLLAIHGPTRYTQD
jgi:hypothetical protein